MSEVLKVLTEFKAWVFSDAGAFAALISVPLALLVLLETIKLRRVETDPEITIYLERRIGSSSLIDLVVKNVGHGQAFDIAFLVEPDTPFWQDRKLTTMTMLADGLNHMAPGQEVRVLAGTFMTINQEPYSIAISYAGRERLLGRARTFKSFYIIDVRQFDGQYEVVDDVGKKTMQALNKIAEAATQISTNTKELARSCDQRNNVPSIHRGEEQAGLSNNVS